MRELGMAFARLLDRLDGELCEWDSWFERLHLPADSQSFLKARSDVQEARPHSTHLLAFGLVPAAFAGAARRVSMLLDGLRFDSEHYDSLGENYPEWARSITMDLMVKRKAKVDKQRLVYEVRGAPLLPNEATEPMTKWLLTASSTVPTIFPGFQVHHLTFTPDDQADSWNLIKRWSV